MEVTRGQGFLEKGPPSMDLLRLNFGALGLGFLVLIVERW